MSKLMSDTYRELNATLHTNVENFGAGGMKWAGLVEVVNEGFGCRTILDYGCGKQTLRKSLPHLRIQGYDPAIPEVAALPRSHDLVVCTDVLEHIEPELLDNVLDNLASLVDSTGMFVISTRPAAKFLADGRNAHLIQMPPEKWVSLLQEYFEVLFFQFSERHSELFIVVSPKFRRRPYRHLSSQIRNLRFRKRYSDVMSELSKVWKIDWNKKKVP